MAQLPGKPPAFNTSAIILAGGLGTRLRSVRSDIPKPMFPCGGKPFLEWVIRWLEWQQITHIILSVCHLSETIESYAKQRVGNAAINAVREVEPLGTGGAIRHAWLTTKAEAVCVVNGDSLLLGDWNDAWRKFSDPCIDGVILGREVEDARRYGSLDTDLSGQLVSFREKVPGRAVINAGVYFLKRSVLDLLPFGRHSIEREAFPLLLAKGKRLHVAKVDAQFIDIGLPETLQEADDFLKHNWPQEFGI